MGPRKGRIDGDAGVAANSCAHILSLVAARSGPRTPLRPPGRRQARGSSFVTT